jgi:hypothetical protein
LSDEVSWLCRHPGSKLDESDGGVSLGQRATIGWAEKQKAVEAWQRILALDDGRQNRRERIGTIECELCKERQ